MRWKEVQKVVQEFPGYVFSGCRRIRSGSERRHRLVIFIEEPAGKQNGVLYQKSEDIMPDENGLINPHLSIAEIFDENNDYHYALPRKEILLN